MSAAAGAEEGQGATTDSSMDTHVRVAVRVRPLIEREAADGALPCVQADEELACVGLGHDRKFTFDHAFGSSSKQDDIYRACVAPLVDSCFDGYNGTVFAYGQTGSGKTHTMGMGSAAPPAGSPQEGIAPRVVRHIFDRIDALCKAQPGARVVVTASFIEIHNEELRDLLALPGTPQKPLAIRECSDGSLCVAGVREVEARTPQELTRLLQESACARATSSTLMNEASSRSHVVATIGITQHTHVTQSTSEGGQEQQQLAPPGSGVQVVTKAKLHLVDLAGSERVKRSGVADSQPDSVYRGAIGNTPNLALKGRFKEAVNINQGLLALGSVISALGDVSKKGSHVPYRDSRLTRLLQDSLGGNSRTAMIACVSAADNSMEESLNTLKWAHRARNISNRPEANRSTSGAASKQSALLSMQAEVGMMALSLARRTAELVPMYAGHGATMLLNQVLGAVTPGSVSSIASCAHTLDTLGALQLRLLHNQEDWHGGDQPQTKLYSINQAVMAGSSSKGLRSHPVVNQSLFEDDSGSMQDEGNEDAMSMDGHSPRESGSTLDNDRESGDGMGKGQVAYLKSALKASRQELYSTMNALKEKCDDLERDEMIFADQQRELLALRAQVNEARGGTTAHNNGVPSELAPRPSISEPGDDGICWTTNAVQLASPPITGRVPVGALGKRGALDSCRSFSFAQRKGGEGEGLDEAGSLQGVVPQNSGVQNYNGVRNTPWQDNEWQGRDVGAGPADQQQLAERLSKRGEGGNGMNSSNTNAGMNRNDGNNSADVVHNRNGSDSGSVGLVGGMQRTQSTQSGGLNIAGEDSEGSLMQLGTRASEASTDGSAGLPCSAELAAAAAERAALEADKAALEAAVQRQQEDFEMVKSALESRMATLCQSISKQEEIIAELQAEEQRSKETNQALNERLTALEAEIGSREEEANELRSQLAGMEGTMREKQEARISKTQAQVSMLRRQVFEVEGSRSAERDRQRNASKAAAVQAELRAMKVEQDALRRRLADRTAVNERSARQHAQEASALKRAADAARSRISLLESENRQQRLQLKKKAEEIAAAENRLKVKANEQHRMSVSYTQSLRRSASSASSVQAPGASPRSRLTPSSSARLPSAPQPSTTPRGLPSTTSARNSAANPARNSTASMRTAAPSPRPGLPPYPGTARQPSASSASPRPSTTGAAKVPLTPRSASLQYSASLRLPAAATPATPRTLSHSQTLQTPRTNRDREVFGYPAHPTISSSRSTSMRESGRVSDSGVPRASPEAKPHAGVHHSPHTHTPPKHSAGQVEEGSISPSPPESTAAQASPVPSPSPASAEEAPSNGSSAYGIQPELEDWLQQQVHTLADRMGREAKASRMLQRLHALQLRLRNLQEQRVDAQQEMLAARADPGVGEQAVEAARLEIMDLDDQLDATDEEVHFVKGELSSAERVLQKGEGSAALELRRRIAGLPALSVRGALQGAMQALVEHRMRFQQQMQEQEQQRQQQQKQQAEHKPVAEGTARQQQSQQQQQEQQQQQQQRQEAQTEQQAVDRDQQGALQHQHQHQQQEDYEGQQVVQVIEQALQQPRQQQQQQEEASQRNRDADAHLNQQHQQQEEASQRNREADTHLSQQQQRVSTALSLHEQPSLGSSQHSTALHTAPRNHEEDSVNLGGGSEDACSSGTPSMRASMDSRASTASAPLLGPGNSPAVRASSAALASAVAGYRSLSHARTPHSTSHSARAKSKPPIHPNSSPSPFTLSTTLSDAPPPHPQAPGHTPGHTSGHTSRHTSGHTSGHARSLLRTSLSGGGIGSKGTPSLMSAPDLPTADAKAVESDEEEKDEGVGGQSNSSRSSSFRNENDLGRASLMVGVVPGHTSKQTSGHTSGHVRPKSKSIDSSAASRLSASAGSSAHVRDGAALKPSVSTRSAAHSGAGGVSMGHSAVNHSQSNCTTTADTTNTNANTTVITTDGTAVDADRQASASSATGARAVTFSAEAPSSSNGRAARHGQRGTQGIGGGANAGVGAVTLSADVPSSSNGSAAGHGQHSQGGSTGAGACESAQFGERNVATQQGVRGGESSSDVSSSEGSSGSTSEEGEEGGDDEAGEKSEGEDDSGSTTTTTTTTTTTSSSSIGHISRCGNSSPDGAQAGGASGKG